MKAHLRAFVAACVLLLHVASVEPQRDVRDFLKSRRSTPLVSRESRTLLQLKALVGQSSAKTASRGSRVPHCNTRTRSSTAASPVRPLHHSVTDHLRDTQHRLQLTRRFSTSVVIHKRSRTIAHWTIAQVDPSRESRTHDKPPPTRTRSEAGSVLKVCSGRCTLCSRYAQRMIA